MWWVLLYCAVILAVAVVMQARGRRNRTARRRSRDAGAGAGAGGGPAPVPGAETFSEEEKHMGGSRGSGPTAPYPASVSSLMRKADVVDDIKLPLAASPPPARTVVASNRPSMSALVSARNAEDLKLAADREATAWDADTS